MSLVCRLHILKANEYQYISVQDQTQCIHQQKLSKDNDIQNDKLRKWASFMYAGKDTKFIAKLFKGYNVKVAFHTKNTRL
jgi:hypothetical protein